MMPLYGFLEGDTIGLLVLASAEETVGDLANKLQQAASVRVAPRPGMKVVFHGRALAPSTTLRTAGFEPLDRFDVVEGEG